MREKRVGTSCQETVVSEIKGWMELLVSAGQTIIQQTTQPEKSSQSYKPQAASMVANKDPTHVTYIMKLNKSSKPAAINLFPQLYSRERT